MTRLGRLVAAVILASGTLLVASSSARADHCKPIDNPPPVGGENRDYCHTPKPTTAPKTPPPTAAPTPAPTSAPTRAPTRPVAPVRTNSGGTSSTPAPTVDLEIPEENPLATPQIIVDGPLEGGENFSVEADQAGQASSWIFGFIVGLLVGGLIGRASWGLRRRRRQQIFG
jgi:hypothetical protein